MKKEELGRVAVLVRSPHTQREELNANIVWVSDRSQIKFSHIILTPTTIGAPLKRRFSFGQRHFVDELPSRTRKSVAEAAAAGKGYVTAGDIM